MFMPKKITKKISLTRSIYCDMRKMRWPGVPNENPCQSSSRGGNFERSAKIEEIRINNSSTPPASVQCLSKLEILSLLTLRWRGEGQEINFQGGKDGARWLLLLLSLLSSSFTLSLGIFKFCRMRYSGCCRVCGNDVRSQHRCAPGRRGWGGLGLLIKHWCCRSAHKFCHNVSQIYVLTRWQ